MNTGPPRGLFGGAITALIPQRFKDVSQFRQVPDNQEVWFDCVIVRIPIFGATDVMILLDQVFVDADADQSIIIEIVERASEASDADAAKFHFNSIAFDNDATESVIEAAPDAVSLAPNFNGI